MLDRGVQTLTHILVVTDDDRMVTGVTRMLGKTHEFVVQKVHPKDQNELLHHIQQAAPDSVIVDSSLIASGSLQMPCLWNGFKRLRILLMSLYSNEIQVFEKREVYIERSDDLIAII